MINKRILATTRVIIVLLAVVYYMIPSGKYSEGDTWAHMITGMLRGTIQCEIHCCY